MNTTLKKYLMMYFLLTVLIGVMLACSGGGGGIGPVPTFTTDTFFPTFTTTTTTNPTTFPTTTTTNSSNYKNLYVKVLRKTNNGIQWLGYEWNETAYVYFQANNWSNNKNVYVNDGYWGSYTRFNYDTYTVNRVDIGIYTYYFQYGDYKVRIGNFYEGSSEAWWGEFTVDYYNPYGQSIYIEFQPNVTPRIIRR